MGGILKSSQQRTMGGGTSQYILKKELRALVNLVGELCACQLREFLLR